MDEVKTCNDCRHYVRGIFGVRTTECMHPKNTSTDLVTGKKTLLRGPYKLRSYGGRCGIPGLMFEPKDGTAEGTNNK